VLITAVLATELESGLPILLT